MILESLFIELNKIIMKSSQNQRIEMPVQRYYRKIGSKEASPNAGISYEKQEMSSIRHPASLFKTRFYQ